MLPVEAFINEWDGGWSTSAKEDGVDWHAFWFFPFFLSDDRALGSWGGEAAVWMRGAAVVVFVPIVALPVDEMIWGWAETFPPDVAVVGEGYVGEDGVLADGLDGDRVGAHGGAWGDAEEAVFRVDGVEAAIFADVQPGDVVADGLNFPAWQGWHEHGEVGLAAGAREGGADVLDAAFWIGDL